ncbi:hypothetical protein [Rhizomonospora bruguierae]|uniref:hypothetical protein n=1 Tax=Rhizomonospora bruguierae TaxID=1581705 RepID=UPI001BCF4215|nr:hypothetical protein [Micromonospora sp. NBRC 107566]
MSAPASTPVPPRRNRPRWAVPAALLIAAWAVPALASLSHTAWLLPPLVLLGTAALLRGGRTLLDRVVLAVGLLIGLACAVGLLWSVWPWGMHPVPVAGTAFTVLLLVAAGTGRRPALPRPGWADALSGGVALLLAAYLSVPYLRDSNFTRRLGILIGGEDNARHEAAFDLIGRLGGYLFVAQGRARQHIFSGMIYYPQGWHLTAALLDGFVRRPTAGPGGPAAVDHYIFWTLAGYGLLLLTLIWLVQWLTGPLHALQRVVAVGLVGALALGTELPRLLVSGYPSEALGLALALIVAGLCVRPLAGVREQLLLLGALLVGVGFTYYLFLLPAGLLVLAWLFAARRRVLAHRGMLLVVAVLTAVLAPITALSGLLVGGQSEALSVGGQTDPVANTLLVLGAVAATGPLARSAWREPVWRWYPVAVAITLLFAAAVALANVAAGASPGYYFIKTVHYGMALLIVGVGALARLLPAPGPGAGPREWAPPTGIAAAVLVATLATSGVIGWTGGLFHVSAAHEDTTWTGAWRDRLLQRQRQARATMTAYRAYPPIPGTVTLMMDTSTIDGYRESVFLSSLQGTSAQTEPGIYDMTFREPQRLRQILARVPGRVRLIAVTPAAGAAAREVVAADPALPARVTIVTLPR